VVKTVGVRLEHRTCGSRVSNHESVPKAYRVTYMLDVHGSWVVEIPQLDGAGTRARTIARARERPRAVIAARTGQDPDSVEVGQEEFDLPTDVAARVEAAARAREWPERAAADLAVKLGEAAVAVAEVTGTRDAGEILGLSHGRVHQLVTSRLGASGTPRCGSRGQSIGRHRAGARHQRRLAVAAGLIGVFFVLELVAGLVTNSLALLSDAGHMLTDLVGLGMALAAIGLANRHARQADSGQHTFGLYRLEILAAFVNALLLFCIAGYVLVDAVRRVGAQPQILGVPMLVVAVVGLVVNLVAFALLRKGASESLNVEGAALEVLADTVGSVGVIVAAVLLEVVGWAWVDAVFGAAIGLWILPRTWRLGGRAARILLQSAPPEVDLSALRAELGALAGVVGVHDLHVWTLTSEMETASAHLVVATAADSHAVLDRARALLQDRYAIAHATLQIEPSDHRGCDEVGW
jgi:cobalt-zinc-cadmium efflux system protein